MELLRRFHPIAAWLVGHEIWPVGIAAAASVLSEKLLPVALLIAGLFWILRWLATGKWTERTPVDASIFLLVLMVPVTLWASAEPSTTIPQVLRLLVGILLFYSLVNWVNSPGRHQWLLRGYAALGLLLSFAGLFSARWAVDKLSFLSPQLYSQIPRLFSDTINANVLAGYLVLIFPILVGIGIFHWSGLSLFDRSLGSLSAISLLIVLVLTESRGALVALSVACVGLCLFKGKWGWVLLGAGGLASAAGILLIGPSRLLTMVTPEVSLIGSSSGRIEIWSRALYIIQAFPLTGIGMGLFGPIVDYFYPLFHYAPGTVFHAHNVFLQVAVDLGIPGLIAWLATLMLVTVTAWQVFQYGKKNSDSLGVGIGAGMIASQVAFVAHGMTDAVTWGMVRPAILVWALWALPVISWSVLVRPSLTQKADLVS
ncbi:MAG: O-antigen ligase family protein [Chloroflexi bacterium]|nr:O-antigen ligase family protein [Chloroflexota bacterium]